MRRLSTHNRRTRVFPYVAALAALLTAMAVAVVVSTVPHNAGPSVPAEGRDEATSLECPSNVAGLALKDTRAGLAAVSSEARSFLCRYSLPSDSGDTPGRAWVEAVWSSAGPEQVWQSRCGRSESETRGLLTTEGTLYSASTYSTVSYGGEQKYSSSLRRLSARLLTDTEPLAFPCRGASGAQGAPRGAAPSGTQTPRAPAPTATPAPQSGQAVPAACDVSGRVTDFFGNAVQDIHISLALAGGRRLDASTDGSGRYVFTDVNPAGATVSVFPEERTRTPGRFRVLYSGQLGALSQEAWDPQQAGSCVRNFDMWGLSPNLTSDSPPVELWPDLLQIYQNTWKAWSLADFIGYEMDYGLPLDIHAWCSSKELLCPGSATADFAFYRGTTSASRLDRPYVAFGHPNSLLSASGVPGNREYHEIGHAYLADLLGDRVPYNPADRNHGGYFLNGSTTDSFVEGFAEFYSMMVSKYVDRDPSAHFYTIGARYDLEVDHKAWEAAGWWEEFTIAGLLLDFEDGDADYQHKDPSPWLTVRKPRITNTPTGVFAVGRVINNSAAALENVQVTVQFSDPDGQPVFMQRTVVLPKVVKPGGEGLFYVAAPEGTQVGDVQAAAGAPPATDDDPVDVELRDLIEALFLYRTEDGGRVSTVADLYRALSGYFAGRDLNGDGVPDITQEHIDQVFLAHGFFGDLDGDQRYDPLVDGETGLSSHPARTLGGTPYPGFIPRHDSRAHPGAFVTVDTGEASAQALVQVEYPFGQAARSYAYVTPAGVGSPVELAAPAQGEDAAITVITVAEGYLPAVALRIRADDFHEGLSQNTIAPFLSAKVSNVPGRIPDDPADGQSLVPAESFHDDNGGGAAGSSGVSGGRRWFGVWLALGGAAVLLVLAAAATVIPAIKGRKPESAAEDDGSNADSAGTEPPARAA